MELMQTIKHWFSALLSADSGASAWSVADIFPWIYAYAFYYPLYMAYLWILGALIYYFRWERDAVREKYQMDMKFAPPVSILVPCHNESDNVEDTIIHLLQQEYPNYEIIAIDDGSTDNTFEILERLAAKHSKVRAVQLKQNQGKATALRMGSLMSRNEFMIGVDADVILAPKTTESMIRHFIYGPKVGAVTGNPRVRTRSTLLGRIQVGEFSAIIGLIKRAQRVIGPIYTVSGAIVAFRKSALHRVGYWSDDMITEDIDISWKLQLAGWEVRYEPEALCWVLTPETYIGLWQQRLRWAQGGVEVASRYFRQVATLKGIRLWTTLTEFLLSVSWAFAIMLSFIMFFMGLLFDLPAQMQMHINFPSWTALFLGITCIMQFSVSFFIDARYEEGLRKFYFWIIWYPFVFWIITTLTTIAALPKGLNHRKGEKAIWVSPDRGL